MAAAGYLSPFVDEQTLGDDEIVLRRVPPHFIDWQVLDDSGQPRITSGGFQDYNAKKAQEEFGLPGACMSVIVLAIVVQENRDVAELLEGYGPTNGLARLTVGAIRRCDQGIQLDPRPDEPWHAVVFAKAKPQKDKTMKNCLASAALWDIAPTATPS